MLIMRYLFYVRQLRHAQTGRRTRLGGKELYLEFTT